MKSKNPFSTQSKVRGALKASGQPMRMSEIRDLIGLSGADGYARVNKAVQELLKSRQIERSGWGRYRYVADRPDADYCAKQRVMQRIMWMRSKNGSPFTVRKISELAGCSLFFAQKYVAYLADKGVIRKEGRVKTAATAYAPLYTGSDEYLKNDDWPVMRSEIVKYLDAALTEMRELAGKFFAVEDFKEETLLNLKQAASRIGDLVEECGKIKGSLSQIGEKQESGVRSRNPGGGQ